MPPDAVPFPLEPTIDLRAVARAMRDASDPGDLARRKRFDAVLADLDAAIRLAGSTPGSLGHKAAWRRAERAATELGDLVALTDRAEPIVAAAVARVRGA